MNYRKSTKRIWKFLNLRKNKINLITESQKEIRETRITERIILNRQKFKKNLLNKKGFQAKKGPKRVKLSEKRNKAHKEMENESLLVKGGGIEWKFLRCFVINSNKKRIKFLFIFLKVLRIF